MKPQMKKWLVRAFWYLPYKVRRTLFPVIRPNSYKFYQRLRDPNNREQKSLRYFDRYQCIFVHVPKTAGKSISHSLFNWILGPHMNILKFQLVFPKPTFDRYFKFAFVRNPYDRLVSAFFYLKNSDPNSSDYPWAKANLSRYDDFETFVTDWVTPQNILTWPHFKPQYRFICDVHDHVLVDFIGRYENLEQDFAIVAQKLQINAELQYRNRGQHRRRKYHTYYTEETKNIVAEVYERDFTILEYDIDEDLKTD